MKLELKLDNHNLVDGVFEHLRSLSVIPDPRRVAWLRGDWSKLSEWDRKVIRASVPLDHFLNNEHWTDAAVQE